MPGPIGFINWLVRWVVENLLWRSVESAYTSSGVGLVVGILDLIVVQPPGTIIMHAFIAAAATSVFLNQVLERRTAADVASRIEAIEQNVKVLKRRVDSPSPLTLIGEFTPGHLSPLSARLGDFVIEIDRAAWEYYEGLVEPQQEKIRGMIRARYPRVRKWNLDSLVAIIDSRAGIRMRLDEFLGSGRALIAQAKDAESRLDAERVEAERLEAERRRPLGLNDVSPTSLGALVRREAQGLSPGLRPYSVAASDLRDLTARVIAWGADVYRFLNEETSGFAEEFRVDMDLAASRPIWEHVQAGVVSLRGIKATHDSATSQSPASDTSASPRPGVS